ncbi:MAG: hypothetical protein KGJ60_11895 [Verrucomicrobiota bacterium]|nr:hypothetical protein [Verrucomicrobiota bacterium]
MHMFKFHCVAAATVVLAGGWTAVHAGDTPTQARARAALEAEMRRLGQLPFPTNQTPAVQTAPAAAIQTAPAATKPIVVQRSPAVTPHESNEDQAKAQAALEAKLRELGAAPPPGSALSSIAVPATAAPQANPEAQAQAQAALRKKMAELNQQQARAQAAREEENVGAGGGSAAAALGNAPGFKPMTPPPLPVTIQQEAALQALLQKYMANEITPEQYQIERAKIMAQKR